MVAGTPVSRSITSGELAYYLCWSPRTATLAELVQVAGARWAVEECFQAAKNETTPGLPSPSPGRPDRHPAAGPATAAGPERGPPACGQPPGPAPIRGNRLITGSDGMALTCPSVNEIRRMHAALCRPATRPTATCTGRCGAAATRPPPANATTSGHTTEITN